MSEIELLDAFDSFDRCRNMVNKLMESLSRADPGITLLALEGLFRIESDVDRNQFPGDVLQKVKSFLRKWRCDSLPRNAYLGLPNQLPVFLRSLTIFKTLEVPLFIDNYGKKKLLSSFEPEEIIDVKISQITRIFHVTHLEEARRIFLEGVQPSDNKNIIKGTWFGLNNSRSVYGSCCFETTLFDLGVKGLHQGEVVLCKQEVNVILYAADDHECSWNELKKPTDEAVKKIKDGAYVKVSIFVPARFLPKTLDEFRSAVREPLKIGHGPFCVREKRSDYECTELNE